MKVNVKHAGKTYLVEVDITKPALDFKAAIFHVTGIPTERMKVMIKGGVLKDDSNLTTIGLKPDQNITVIGTAGPLPSVPTERATFTEDLDSTQGNASGDTPAGLVNLGQTCYLNSTLQVLRTIPNLQDNFNSLPTANMTTESRVAVSLRNLFTGLAQTSESVPPFALLNNLRTMAPQFAEQDNHGHFSQQDADEAWTHVVSALRSTLRTGGNGDSFIDKVMSIELTNHLQCVEAPDEAPIVNQDTTLKLECNISITTNFLMSGILDSLNQQIEKTSPTLGRMAHYNQQSRISRLPQNLVIHMVRFYWRRDIQKKAKIMRKVKYPLQLDALDLVTDDLRQRVQPINSAVKQILKERDDRAKLAKKAGAKMVTADFDRETELRRNESTEMRTLIRSRDLDQDGTNPTAIYELYAMVTHKGASADSGHYIGWTRKENEASVPSGEEEWFKFDDDKVSVVKADKILSMDGGGEDSVAYILLYRAVDI